MTHWLENIQEAFAADISLRLGAAAFNLLRRFSLGSDEQRALGEVFSNVSARFVEELLHELDKDQAECVRDVFDVVLSDPDIANAFVGVALKEGDASFPYEKLKEKLIEAGLDLGTIPLNIDATLVVFVNALEFELTTHAMRRDSALANWVTIGRLRSASEIQMICRDLLLQQSSMLKEFKEQLEQNSAEMQRGFASLQESRSQSNRPQRGLQQYAIAGMEVKISDLSSALSKAKDEELEAAREQYRCGNKSDAYRSLSTLIEDENWDDFEPALKGKILRINAAWVLNDEDDLAKAKLLIAQSKEIAPNENIQVIEAHYLRRAEGFDAALKILEKPSDINALNFKLVLVLIQNGAQEAAKILEEFPNEWEPDAETHRLKALVSLFLGDGPKAIEFASLAMDAQPNWVIVKRTYAQVCFYLSLSDDVRPKELEQAPYPIPIEMVRSDPESLRLLRSAQEIFEKLQINDQLSEEEREAQNIWRYASLVLDRNKFPDAEEFFNSLCIRQPVDPRILIWGAATGQSLPNIVDFSYLIKEQPPNIEKIDASARYLLVSGQTKAARDHLESAEETYKSSNNKDGFMFRWAELLAHEGDIEGAENQCAQISNEGVQKQLQLLIFDIAARRTGEPQPVLNHLFRTFEDTGDAKYLLEYCERLAGMNRWQEIADHTSVLISEIPSDQVLRLCVFANWNAQKPAECLQLMEEHEHLFESGIFPADMQRLKITAYRTQGAIDEALRDAQTLVRRDPSVENTIAYLDVLLICGDLATLATEARSLVDREDVQPEDLLRIIRLTRSVNMNFARTAWQRAVKLINDGTNSDTIAEAFFLAFELNLEEEAQVLLPLMEGVKADKNSSLRAVSLNDLKDVQEDWEKNRVFVNEQYSKGQIPSHFVADALNVPMSEIYHGMPSENRANEKPANNIILFSRHGGKVVAEELLEDIADCNLFADFSALLMAEDLGVLDEVIETFGKIHTSIQLPVAINNQIDRFARTQPSRRIVDEKILGALNNQLVNIFPRNSAREDLKRRFEKALGSAWMGLMEQVIENDGFMVEYLPLTANDLSGTRLARVPKEINRHLVDARTLIKALERHGLITHAEYRQAATKIGSEGRKRPKRVTPPIGARLYFQFNTITAIVDSGLFDLVCDTYSVLLDPQYIDHAKAGIREDKHRSQMRDWLIDFQEKVRRHIENGAINYFPEPNLSSDERRGIGASPESLTFLQLVKRPKEPNDVIWVDDRWFNGFSDCDGAPIVSIYDLALVMRIARKFTERDFYELISKMRSSNFRYVPITANEILYHLNQAKVLENEVVETRELGLLRRYLNACLLDKTRLQRPPQPQGSSNLNGEVAFIMNSLLATRDALISIWNEFPKNETVTMARADWLLENLFVGVFGTHHLLPANAAHDRFHELQGLDITELYSKALDLLLTTSSALHNSRAFEGFCDWINTIIASKLFQSSPDVARHTATTLSKAFIDRFQNAPAGKESQMLATFMGRELFQALPEPVKDALVAEKTLLEFSKIDVGSVVSVAESDFQPDEFWAAVREALDEKEPELTALAGDKKFRLRVRMSNSKDSPTAIHLIDDNGNEELMVHPVIEVIANSDKVDEILKTTFRGWFDCDQKSLENAVREISKSKQTWEQVELIDNWRTSSATQYYADLEQQFIVDKQFKEEDLLPPSAEAMLRHFRLSTSQIDEEFSPSNLDSIAAELISEEGLRSALNRLACLPCRLPEHVITSVMSLGQDEQLQLMDHLYGRWQSPIHRVHLVELLGHLSTTDKQYQERLVKLINDCFDTEYEPQYELFEALLCYTYDRIRLWPDAKSWSSPTRFLMTWSHASRLQNLFAAGRAEPSELTDTFRKRHRTLSVRLVFEHSSTESRDILSPHAISHELIFVIGLANCLKPIAGQLAPISSDIFSRARLVQNVSGKVYPVAGLMFDPFLATNICASFLGGDRQELLSQFDAAPTPKVLSTRHTLKAVKLSLSELRENPGNLDAWMSIFIYQRGFPFHKDLQIDFDNLLSSFDLVDCWRQSRKAAEIGLRVMCDLARWCSNDDAQELILNQSLDLAREIASTTEFEDQTDVEKERKLSFERIIDCSAQGSVQLDDPEASSRRFAEFMVQAYLIDRVTLDILGANILRSAFSLPASQLGNLWPMILEARARS